MFNLNSVMYLTSWEAFYQCFGIIDNFKFHADDYCLCSRYERCIQSASAKKDYCAVCRVSQHYPLERLNEIKHNSFKLAKFYLSIVREIAEALSLNLSIYLWKSDYFNWICLACYKGSNEDEYMDRFRINLDDIFS